MAVSHTRDVADGDFGRSIQDFTGNALNELMQLSGPPPPTTRRILPEQTECEAVQIHVHHSNVWDALQRVAHWEEFDGIWGVIEIARVAA
jgi:hypothetical protein